MTSGKGTLFIRIYGDQDVHIGKEVPHMKVKDETDLLDDHFFKINGIKNKSGVLRQIKEAGGISSPD